MCGDSGKAHGTLTSQSPGAVDHQLQTQLPSIIPYQQQQPLCENWSFTFDGLTLARLLISLPPLRSMLAPAILLLALSIVKATSIPLRNDATNSTLHNVDHVQYVNETQRQHNKTWQSSTMAALSEHTKSDPNSNHPPVTNSNHPPIPNSNHPPIPNSNHPLITNSNRPPITNSNHPSIPNSNDPQIPNSNHPPIPNSNHPPIPNSNHPQIPNSNHPLITNSNRPPITNSNHPSIPNSNDPQIPNSNHPPIPNSNYPPIPNSNHPQIPNSNHPPIPNSNHPPIPNSNHPPISNSNHPPIPNSNHPPIPKSNYPPIPNSNHPPIPNSNYPPIPNSNHPPITNSNHPPIPNSNHPPIPKYNHPPIPNSHHPPIPNSIRPPIPNLTNLWEEGVIPFVIDGNFTADGKALLLDAIIQWQMKTCVVFVDKAPQHKDYVVFTKLPCGCCAAVGNQRTGPQPISIGDGCEQTGIVLHELGHVIGLSDVTDDIPQASPIHQLINVSNSVNGSAPGTTTKTLESLFNLTMDVIITNDKMKASDTEEERDESISENDSIMRYGEKLFQSKLYSNHPNEVKYVESADFFIELKMKIYVSDVKATNEFYRCPKCGKSFQHPKGNVTHLPLANASAFCQWRIIAGYGETVLFKITGMHFNASCDDTYLEIRDGPSKSSALLEKLCAGSAPLSVTSTGPLMFIEYRSKTGPGEGFEGNYMFLCGGEITVEDKVYLGSPNYPYEYVPNKNCSWKLSAGKGFRIVLRLELFKLEGSENCKSDYLEVRDGATAASKLFGRYCSQSIPSVFISTGENLLVTFVSDGFYQTEGFLGNVVREEIK